MSRVRILNLPNDCTEKELRDYFTKSVPATAPPLEITDVMIKRLAAEESKGGTRTHTAAVSTTPRLGKIRMAFVGFRSSAAGHFVVQYYNGSYFRSSKIKVELAKGLNEVGVTLNMKKKLERQQQQQQQQEEGEKDTAEAGGGGAGTGTGKRPRERSPRTGRTHSITSAEVQDREAEGEGGDLDLDGRKKTRKELFMDARTKATEGPSWAAEVLLPQGTDANPEGSNLDEKDDDLAAMEAARLQAALEKQQALGAVSDLDFLTGLAGGETGGTGQGTVHNPSAAADHQGPRDGGDREDLGRGDGAVHEAPPPQVEAEAGETPEDLARLSRRVRIGNIPYTATADHVKQFAASLVGSVEEVHIPLTKDTRQSKGAAFVTFTHAEDAVRALTLCRGAILMGRLLRVSAAAEDPHGKAALEREARRATTAGGSGTGLAGSSDFKLKKELERRGGEGAGAKGGPAGHVSWNTMYMSSSAAVDTVAQRLGVASTDLVSVQAKGAAVRAAIAEAYLTSEIQQVLSDEGVAFDVLESGGQSLLKARSNTTILVKNLQLAGPDEATELSKMFVRFGTLETSVFPSSGTFALFRFLHPQDARTAFTRLSYKLFKSAPLFLEWAPVGAIVESDEAGSTEAAGTAEAADEQMGETAGASGQRGKALPGTTVVHTLFLTNIPFTITEEDFRAFLIDTCPRLARSPDTLITRLVLQQQQGRAYLTLADAATYGYCLAKLHNKTCGTRVLACVPSKQTESEVAGVAAEGRSTAARNNNEEDDDAREANLHKTASVVLGASQAAGPKVPHGSDPHKIIVKNVPFEATEADIRELFAAFSEVKSVRLPRKVNNFSHHRENNHRGFAFVEFLSESEAARAMEVLRATHLYGRHLVLQYAKLEG